MATPTFTNPPTLINAADIAADWTFAASGAQDTEFKKEGQASNSGIMRNSLATAYHTQAGISMANQHVRCWINFTALAFLAAESAGGMEFYMTDGANTAYWVVFGSDTYFGGWRNVIVNFEGTPTSGVKPTGNVTTWGFRFNRTGAPRQATNTWVDVLRYGDGYTITGGTSGDRITLENIFVLDYASAYGVLDKYEGVYYALGKLTFGNGATTTYVNIANSVLVFINSSRVASTLYGLVGQGSGCTITISSSVLRSAGTSTATRFALNMGDANLAAFSMTSCFVTHAGTCTFKTGQTVTGNTFSDALQIVAGGADMRGSVISGYEGTADTAALVWNVNADTSTKLDNSSITKGTAATHAIELGANIPASLTLNKIAFSGYNASDNQQDSTIYVSKANGTLTLNCTGCTGNISVKSAGCTVTLQLDQITLTVSGIQTGSDVVIYTAGTETILANSQNIGGTTYAYIYPGTDAGDLIDIGIFKEGYVPYYIRNYQLGAASAPLPVSQEVDRYYLV